MDGPRWAAQLSKVCAAQAVSSKRLPSACPVDPSTWSLRLGNAAVMVRKVNE